MPASISTVGYVYHLINSYSVGRMSMCKPVKHVTLCAVVELSKSHYDTTETTYGQTTTHAKEFLSSDDGRHRPKYCHVYE
jgi:hypothetical protein